MPYLSGKIHQVVDKSAFIYNFTNKILIDSLLIDNKKVKFIYWYLVLLKEKMKNKICFRSKMK